MKFKKREGYVYDKYINPIKGSFYYHRIDGPAWIKYKTKQKQEIKYVRYWLYDKIFHPWWLSELWCK